MKNNNSDWGDSGLLFVKPEWKRGQTLNNSFPVSHTKDSLVEIELTFEALPSDADPTDWTVGGVLGLADEAGAMFHNSPFLTIDFFTSESKIGGGLHTITKFSSATNLPDYATTLTGDGYWVVTTTDDGLFIAGTSSGHTIYVTIDTPRDAPGLDYGITQKRMARAVKLVGAINSNTTGDIIDGVFKNLAGSTLNKGSADAVIAGNPGYFGPYGAWPIADFAAQKAECQANCRFVRTIAMQVGCPGTIKVSLLFVSPYIQHGLEVSSHDFDHYPIPQIQRGGLHEAPEFTVKGKVCTAVMLNDGSLRVPRRVDQTSGIGVANAYAAYLEFVSNYYQVSVSFQTKKDALKSGMKLLAWIHWDPRPAAFTIEEISSTSSNWR
jgi:hypothetical protein